MEGGQRLEKARERIAKVEHLLNDAIGLHIELFSDGLTTIAEQLS